MVMEREAPAMPAGEDHTADPGPALDAAAALAGAVAHDLGNMLTVVLGNAELLVEGLADRPDLRELAALILGAAQRGSELSGRLDRFARPVRKAETPTDTAAVLRAFGRRLAYSLPPGITFDLDVEPDLRGIGLAEPALVAALDELVANALASLRDKGALRIRATNLFSSDEPPRVLIAVEDDGPGMAPETLNRTLAVRFTAGVAGHKTAIGLALSMRVAMAARGRLLVASTRGHGARVSLDLPALS
jgi:signal transduction histidine kinase